MARQSAVPEHAHERGPRLRIVPSADELCGDSEGRVGVRVLAIDTSELTLAGCRALLTREPWTERCLTARSLDRAVELAERYQPHVALATCNESAAGQLVRRLKASAPQVRVLLMARHCEITPQGARAAGAIGVVPADTPASQLLRAIHSAASGRRITLLARCRGEVRLSPRESQVLRLAATGATNPEIAAALILSRETVKHHMHRVCRKLDARNRTEAIARARSNGLLR